MHNTLARALSRKASGALLDKRARKMKRPAIQHNWIHKQNNAQLGITSRYATEHLNIQINLYLADKRPQTLLRTAFYFDTQPLSGNHWIQ
jgi:hypothetical protein